MSKEQIITVRGDERPSWGSRLKHAVRSYWMGPFNSNSPDVAQFFGGQPSRSGVSVNSHTALNYSAVWAAVNLISSTIAGLPLMPFRYLPDGGKQRAPGLPIYSLLHDSPNPEMSSFTFRQVLMAHVLLWGNAYAEIVRPSDGTWPTALWPLTPDRVTPYRVSPDASLQYRIVNPNGSEIILDGRDVLHLKGLGYDGVTGYSVISKARDSIGLGLAAEQFGSTFFGNGATFGGILKYPGPKPTDGSQENVIQQINAKHQGVDRAHRMLALYNGASYDRLGIPPNDAQFVESRKFQVTDIARWFNVPPHKLGDLERATFSNVESQESVFVSQSLLPWLRMLEQELTSKLLVLPSDRRAYCIEHVIEGLLRGDAVARANFYEKMITLKCMTPNEVRQRENLPPLPGGDVPAQLTAGAVPVGGGL